MKNIFFLIGVSFIVPVIFLLIGFFAPDPVSIAVIEFATFPVELIDIKVIRELSFIIFGRQANLAPIGILLSFLFWFLFTLFVLLLIYFIKKYNQRSS